MKVVYSLMLSLFFCSVATAKPVHLVIDTGGSEIKWKGTKEFTGDAHNGTINVKKGFVIVENEKIIGGELTIDMTTMKNADITDENYKSKLINHLNSPDFFETAKYPEAKYVIKSVNYGSETPVIEGDLTIKDKTKPMRITANIKKDGKIYIAKGSADFDRSQFNVTYNSTTFFPNLIKTGKDKVIKNTIELEFTLKTVPEK